MKWEHSEINSQLYIMLSIRLGDNLIVTGVFTADFSCYVSDNKTRSQEKVAIKLEPNQLRVWVFVLGSCEIWEAKRP